MILLQSLHDRAAIVGPHGHGKSTLLRQLQHRLEDGGLGTRSLFISRDVKLPWKAVKNCLNTMSASEVLFFDGANHLSYWRFYHLRRHAQKHGLGLIITSHREGLLPTLAHCRTTVELLSEITHQLLPRNQTIHSTRLQALFYNHQGNLRDCLWQLYDEYQPASQPGSSA